MVENIERDKVFYAPGDLVTIKHDMPNKPTMLVKGKETKMVKDENYFKGIRCFWFTSVGAYQEETFSTKDLAHVEVTRVVEVGANELTGLRGATKAYKQVGSDNYKDKG
jgi:hypothetical protein